MSPTKQLLVIIATAYTCLSLSSPLQSEVYRWVDKDGKVHYGDRKPDKTKAENISENVKKNNLDSSKNEADKLEKIFARETEEEKRYRQKQANKDSLSEEGRQKYCAKARKYLQTLQGPVYFVDKDGREYNITEKERAARVEKLQKEIRKNCS